MATKLPLGFLVVLALLMLTGAAADQRSIELQEWAEKGLLRTEELSVWCVNFDEDWYLQVRYQSKHSESAIVPLARLSSAKSCADFIKNSGIASIDLVDGSLVVDTDKRLRYFPITLPGFYKAASLERVPWKECLQPSSRVAPP